METNVIYIAFGGGGGGRGGGLTGDGRDDPGERVAEREREPERQPEQERQAKEEETLGGNRKSALSRDGAGGLHLQGDHRCLVDLYTRRQVARLVGVDEAKLRWWERCGLVRPSRSYGRERYYTFENLIVVRAARELVAKGCKPARIKKAIRKLCEEMPLAEKPLTKMKVYGNDRRLVIEREGREVEIDSGQILINFAVSAMASDLKHLVSLDPRAQKKVSGGRTAYEWFLEGVRLQNDEGPEAADGARKAYEKALELAPDFAPALTNIGNMKMRGGQRKEAEEIYREAIKADPYLAQPYYNLGCLKLEDGRTDVALVYLRKAQELDPEFVDVYFNLALACEYEGRKSDAAGHFRKFLELDADADSEWSSVARQHLATLDR